MNLNRLKSHKFRAGALVVVGALIAIIAASSAARHPDAAPVEPTAAASTGQGD
ncbi:hypothetical protein [Maricaulis sp.]|uniref:hypothetical protein n=1 Tax=Maricaulis sp. TaxID=1486257 RepID=UPI003A8CEF06